MIGKNVSSSEKVKLHDQECDDSGEFVASIGGIMPYLFAAPQTPWRIRDAIARIKEYLAFNNYTISHVYREANYTADALASFGLSCTEPTVFFSFNLVPEAVLSSYLYDLRAFSAPRRLYQ
nr:ribonuclease H [Ipomoea batatas]